MTIGPWFLFDRWLLNSQGGAVNINSDQVKAIICGDGQVLDPDFVGASGHARYADITDELPTADGYTAGGLALTGEAASLAAGIAKFTANAFQWTITAPIAGAKYIALYDDTDANKSLIQAFDLDVSAPGTNTVTISAGLLTVTPNANGLLRWYQL